MVYKIILVGLLLVGSFVGLQAQEQLEDIVYLKDGKTIKGKVLEYNPQKNIKIKILGESVLVYKSSEVVKIERKENTSITGKKAPKSHRPTNVGPYHIIGGETTFYVGNGIWRNGISLGATIGWSFHRLLGLGGGCGMIWGDDILTPIYANIRGNFMKSSASLFYDINIGYGVPLTRIFEGGNMKLHKAEGGLHLRPSIGIRFSSKKRTHVFLDMGCTIQFAKYEYTDWNNDLVVEDRPPYRPSIRVGIVF